VLAHAERIPNHTCVESVRRDRYEAVTGPPARPCDSLLARRKLPAFSWWKGVLLRVERHHIRPATTVVLLQLESVEIAGSKIPLAAVRDWSRELAVMPRGKRGPEIPLPLPSEKKAGAFRFTGDQAVLRRGLRLEWRTVDATVDATVDDNGG
jgi:hypothetical protein